MIRTAIEVPPWPVLAASAAGLYLLHSFLLVLNRVYLSPLSRFPGPKLAAATQWYETYYEMFYRGGGMFTKHIKQLHEEYGQFLFFRFEKCQSISC